MDVNSFTYFFSSSVATVGYFFGPWIFGAFIILGFFYTFIYSKRYFIRDNYLVLLALVSVLGFSQLFFPNFVGNGLKFFIEKNINTELIYLLTLAATFGLLFGTFKGSFHYIIQLLQQLGEKTIIAFERTKNRAQITATSSKKLLTEFPEMDSVRNRVSDILKGSAEKLRSETSETKMIDAPVETITPIRVSALEDKDITDDEGDETEFSDIPKVQPSDLKKDVVKAAPAKIIKKSEPMEFFKSKDLIQTISSESRKNKNVSPDDDYFTKIITSIEEKFDEFKIPGRIINILKGPVVDTFELELGHGVKVQKVMSIQKDLTLALCGAPVRIVYPMKGKSTVGLEVPRSPREIIYLDEVLESNEFKTTTFRLPVAMGKDAFGEPAVVDLAAMPHMLVAGATGAGKSVFINTLLVSLLVQKSPDQMKLILIDPKQLELALYSELPHLILPVVTEPNRAGMSLLWACQEMERRYSILAEMGVRNIDQFNKKVKVSEDSELLKINKYYEDSDTPGYELPFIVIIVDEFADLILTKEGKQIENAICRLAAKARAAGIHLVLATQRPSVDVITGLIKANFPTRVSFRVTSMTDSRTILNTGGSEMLLGMGDMLYKHGIEMNRLHSAYVSEDEIELLTKKLSTISSSFNEFAVNFVENGGEIDAGHGPVTVSVGNLTGDAVDDKYKEAIGVAIEFQKVSASFLQRKLGIGYNRAAKIIEQMEDDGIVGPQQGSKPRSLLRVPTNF